MREKDQTEVEGPHRHTIVAWFDSFGNVGIITRNNVCIMNTYTYKTFFFCMCFLRGYVSGGWIPPFNHL